jgi:histidyl-tRNA synthetase
MSTKKPGIPKGMRDFGPEVMVKRNYIFGVIRDAFEKYGFAPLETPAMENLSVLTGKYGDEGDQLLYKVLNSGDFLSACACSDLEEGYKAFTGKISEKGLRYDLTVPLARYVAMQGSALVLPFKRYQIQPVWRADRPQKARYREFYQCDADVIGSDSLLCEAECVAMVVDVFRNLGLVDFEIRINHRKILRGITDIIGAPGRESAFSTALDKLEKTGRDKVSEELKANGFSDQALRALEPVFDMQGMHAEALLDRMESFVADSAVAMEGVRDLRAIFRYVGALSTAENLVPDITLARGLSYYTGAIFEVRVRNSSIRSSVGGGGRYDNLTGVFGLEDVSGVGISFGVDRIFDVMEERACFPAETVRGSQLMITNFDPETTVHALKLLGVLRQTGIRAEIYPDRAKLKKQMNYANKKNIPFVLMVGSREVEESVFGLKDMETGAQESLSVEGIIAYLKDRA